MTMNERRKPAPTSTTDASTRKVSRAQSLKWTVQFDVGGKLCRVSRSLLEAYPETLLARLAAKTKTKQKSSVKWRKHDENDENGSKNDSKMQDPATIFIDGNGERFPYILDFMRDKEVHLPLSVPKAALLRDLEYYGFDMDNGVRAEDIHDGSSSAEAAKQIAKCESLYQQELERCHRTVRTFQKKITYLNVAHACFLSYSKSGHHHAGNGSDKSGGGREYYLGDYSLNLMTLKDDINTSFAVDAFDRNLFDECLLLHGLKYVSHRTIDLCSSRSIWYYVSLHPLSN